jgi:hypothetical protein
MKSERKAERINRKKMEEIKEEAVHETSFLAI